MFQQIAHNIENKERTEDIQINKNVEFSSMLLSEPILHGLLKCGFKKPSPIQLKAIPIGRCGFDLVIKAKSGTGKTAVFGIIALEMIDVKQNDLQVLILAPTREIAVQIQQVLLSIGSEIIGLKVEYFIGGTPLSEDTNKLKNCHIAVGAPGRVKHLIKSGAMNVQKVRLFVLDEADKLVQSSYQPDINYIYNKLSARKQMVAASATYPSELDIFLGKYMVTPTHVTPDDRTPVLLGIKQFVSVVDSHLNVMQQMTIKMDELVRLLQMISFTQCLVFLNYQSRAESLCNNLTRLGWPSVYISGAQSQQMRLNAVTSLKEFKCRILTTTDLTARGIDAANVDLIINYEVPYDVETYLHRMGRAGRYGSSGICISIVSANEEQTKLQTIISSIGIQNYSISVLPKGPVDLWNCNESEFEKFGGEVPKDKDVSSTIASHLLDQSEGTDSEFICSVGTLLENLNETELKITESSESTTINLSDNEPQVSDSKKAKPNISELNLKQAVKDIDNSNADFAIEAKVLQLQQAIKNVDVGKSNYAVEAEVLQFHQPVIEVDTSDTNLATKTEVLQFQHSTQDVDSNNSDFLTSGADFGTDTDSSSATEGKIRQNSTTLNKNIALYNLTRLLVDDNESVNDSSVNSVGDLLDILKQQDEPVNHEHRKSKYVKNKQRKRPELERTTLACGCSEQLFTKAFLCAISENDTWNQCLCQLHSKVETSTSSPTHEIPELMEQSTTNYDENILTKAYDYAIQIDDNTTEYSEEPFGYASGYSCQPLTCKRKHETSSDYESYYDYYSNMLLENGSHFSDVSDFEKWFRKWQENVYAVRNYVLQDVFSKEILS